MKVTFEVGLGQWHAERGVLMNGASNGSIYGGGHPIKQASVEKQLWMGLGVASNKEVSFEISGPMIYNLLFCFPHLPGFISTVYLFK